MITRSLIEERKRALEEAISQTPIELTDTNAKVEKPLPSGMRVSSGLRAGEG